MAGGCTKTIFSGARWDVGGHKCSLKAIEGTGFCKRHQPNVEAVRREFYMQKIDESIERSRKAYDALAQIMRRATEEERKALSGFTPHLREVKR